MYMYIGTQLDEREQALLHEEQETLQALKLQQQQAATASAASSPPPAVASEGSESKEEKEWEPEAPKMTTEELERLRKRRFSELCGGFDSDGNSVSLTDGLDDVCGMYK